MIFVSSSEVAVGTLAPSLDGASGEPGHLAGASAACSREHRLVDELESAGRSGMAFQVVVQAGGDGRLG